MSDSESGTPGAQSPLSRRSVLKGLAGAAGLAVVPGALLEACSSRKKTTAPSSSAAAPPRPPLRRSSAAAAPPSSAAAAPASSAAAGGGAATGTISFGSNYSDAVPKGAFAATIAGFTSANPNAKVTINTVTHNDFQNNINNYLQGTPDDLFTWFAGFRMRFFASQGLATPIDDVWDKIGANFSDAFKAASKGDDGHYYFVPLYNYPWCIFYRKSVFAAKGYQIPATWDAFVALQKQMQKDGLVPMAMGEKDAWPALGTFDIINMRLNGFQFHMDLMAHKVPWDDPKVLARLHPVDPDPALPAARRERPHLAGRRKDACSTSRLACTSWAPSSPSSSPAPTSTTSTSSRTLRSTRPTPKTPLTLRSMGS